MHKKNNPLTVRFVKLPKDSPSWRVLFQQENRGSKTFSMSSSFTLSINDSASVLWFGVPPSQIYGHRVECNKYKRNTKLKRQDCQANVIKVMCKICQCHYSCYLVTFWAITNKTKLCHIWSSTSIRAASYPHNHRLRILDTNLLSRYSNIK